MNQPQLGSFDSIPLAAIRPSGTNPRKHFDAMEMEELTRSVQENGVIVPLLLRPNKAVMERDGTPITQQFEIVAGERRYRAAVSAGIRGVPAEIRDISNADAAAKRSGKTGAR